MRVLITGSLGFVGRALTRRYALKGHAVVGLDAVAPDVLTEETHLQRFTPNGAHFHWDTAGAHSHDTLWQVLERFRPELVYHLAALSDLRQCANEPHRAIEINVGGTSNLLLAVAEVAADHGDGPRRLVIAGSGEEYGAGEPERWAALNPRNIYGATKAAASALALGFWHAFEVPASIARMATIYGPGQSGKFVSSVIERLLRGEPVTLHSKGSAKRDWLYIEDAVDGLMAVAEHGDSGAAYNLAGYEETTVGAVAHLIADMLRDRGLVRDYELVPVEGGNLSHRIKMNRADSGFQLRWSPTFSLVNGLERTVDAAVAARQAAAAC